MVQFAAHEVDQEREWVFYVDENERFEDVDDDSDETYFSLYQRRIDGTEFPVYTDYPHGCFHSSQSEYDNSDVAVSPSDAFWKALRWWQVDGIGEDRIETINEECEDHECSLLSALFIHDQEDYKWSPEMKTLLRDAFKNEGGEQ